MRTYTTVQGDMWDKIAFNELGSTDYTDELMNVNRKYLDVFVFDAGVVLTIPDITPKKSAKLPPWKKVTG